MTDLVDLFHNRHEFLARLRYRGRRGLQENDLLLAYFFERYEAQLPLDEALALNHLLKLSDPDLLDVLLSRVDPEIRMPGMEAVLKKLRFLKQNKRE